MKRAILALSILSLASIVFAVPFASQISVSDTTLYPGMGCDISYFINQAGGTATIEIVNKDSESVVATFSGAANQGDNTVTWDGTADNAGGASLPQGDYRVRIQVDASATAGWAEITSNHSVGDYVPDDDWGDTTYNTLWDGFSPMETLIANNPDRDAFGYVLCVSCWSTQDLAGHVVFNTDLSLALPGDGQNFYLGFPGTVQTDQDLWGNAFDPEEINRVWAAGQNTADTENPIAVMTGLWNSSLLTDVTNGNADLANARDIAVTMEGSDKYAYVTSGLAQIWKCKIENNQIAQSPAPFNILGLSDTARYSKGVDLDSEGNLYWASRFNDDSSGDGGAVFRWDKSQIEAATEGSLSESNAAWQVNLPGSNLEGTAIDANGEVYAAIGNEDSTGNDGSYRGIYYIGNTSTASLNTTLDATDRIYAYPGTDYDATLSTYSTGLSADYGGNLYYTDRGREQIRCIGPGGETSISAYGPLSQTISIEATPLSADTSWSLYE